MFRISSGFNDFSVCHRHECRGCKSYSPLGDPHAMEQYLRSLKADLVAVTNLRRMADRFGDSALLSLMSDDQLVDHVAALIASGRLRVCDPVRQKPVPVRAAAPARAAPRSAPPPPRPQRRAPAPAPAPPPSTSVSDVDPVAAAQVLREAAQNGVPFCEECMKAKAARSQAPAGAA